MNDVSKKSVSYNKIRFFSKEWFLALWQGDRPLWEAWILLGILISVLVYAIFPQLVQMYPNSMILLGIIGIFLQLFWWIAVWRCARNANKFFLFLARGLVLIAVIGTIWQHFVYV